MLELESQVLDVAFKSLVLIITSNNIINTVQKKPISTLKAGAKFLHRRVATKFRARQDPTEKNPPKTPTPIFNSPKGGEEGRKGKAETMYNLTAIEAYRPPSREEIYILDIVALAAGPVTISSDQQLCAFDAGAGLSRGPARSWTTAHGNVGCARGFGVSATAGGGGGELDNVVCTAGEDGSVALWDLRVEGPRAQVAKLTGAFLF